MYLGQKEWTSIGNTSLYAGEFLDRHENEFLDLEDYMHEQSKIVENFQRTHSSVLSQQIDDSFLSNNDISNFNSDSKKYEKQIHKAHVDDNRLKHHKMTADMIKNDIRTSMNVQVKKRQEAIKKIKKMENDFTSETNKNNNFLFQEKSKGKINKNQNDSALFNHYAITMLDDSTQKIKYSRPPSGWRQNKINDELNISINSAKEDVTKKYKELMRKSHTLKNDKVNLGIYKTRYAINDKAEDNTDLLKKMQDRKDKLDEKSIDLENLIKNKTKEIKDKKKELIFASALDKALIFGVNSTIKTTENAIKLIPNNLKLDDIAKYNLKFLQQDIARLKELRDEIKNDLIEEHKKWIEEHPNEKFKLSDENAEKVQEIKELKKSIVRRYNYINKIKDEKNGYSSEKNFNKHLKFSDEDTLNSLSNELAEVEREVINLHKKLALYPDHDASSKYRKKIQDSIDNLNTNRIEKLKRKIRNSKYSKKTPLIKDLK